MPAVLINCRAASRPELGGVERWARELATRLPALGTRDYRLVRPPAAMTHRAGQLWEQAALPLEARRVNAPLLINPANLAPVAFPRNLVHIFDAAALREPSWYSNLYAGYQRRLLPQIARRAQAIVTGSQFAKDELIELLGVSGSKVHVIAGGVDASFSPAADAGEARARLSLDAHYVLCVASRTARKNLGSLEPAARLLAAEGIELVVAGGDRPQFKDQAGAGAVRFLGYVDDALLPGLYAGASAFVLPSLHEGFGLTALEAMASGVPTVLSSAGALPETGASAALYADPLDPLAIADQILAAIGNQKLADAGVARAAQFSWDRTALSLDQLVGELVASK